MRRRRDSNSLHRRVAEGTATATVGMVRIVSRVRRCFPNSLQFSSASRCLRGQRSSASRRASARQQQPSPQSRGGYSNGNCWNGANRVAGAPLFPQFVAVLSSASPCLRGNRSSPSRRASARRQQPSPRSRGGYSNGNCWNGTNRGVSAPLFPPLVAVLLRVSAVKVVLGVFNAGFTTAPAAVGPGMTPASLPPSAAARCGT